MKNVTKDVEFFYSIILYLLLATAHPQSTCIVVCVMCFVILMISIIIFCRPINHTDKIERVVKKRKRNAIKALKGIVLIGMTFHLAFWGCEMGCNWICEQIAIKKIEEKNEDYIEGYTISSCLLQLKAMEDESWCHLSIKERMELARLVLKIELQHLGLDNNIRMSLADLEGTIAGQYYDMGNQITLDEEFLAECTYDSMIFVVAHECWHAMEHQLISVYDELGEEHRGLWVFRRVEQYRKEFANYIMPNDNFEAYENQAAEIDANSYAEERTQRYRQILRAHFVIN